MNRSNTQGVWEAIQNCEKGVAPTMPDTSQLFKRHFSTCQRHAKMHAQGSKREFTSSCIEVRLSLGNSLGNFSQTIAIQAIHLLSLSTGAIDSCNPSICKLANSAPTFHLRMPHVQSCASDGWLPNQCRGQKIYDPFSSIFHMPAGGAS